jgi:hypothetical protein
MTYSDTRRQFLDELWRFLFGTVEFWVRYTAHL